MRRFAVFLLLLAALTVCFAAHIRAKAQDGELSSLTDALPDGRDAMERAAQGDFAGALRTLWEKVRGQIRTELSALVRSAAAVFAVCTLCAMAGAFAPERTRLIALIGTAAIFSLCFGEIQGAGRAGAESIEKLSAFGKTLLPTLCAAQIASGALGSAGTVYTAAVFVCDTALVGVKDILTPLVCAYCALTTAQSLSGNEGLGKLARLLRTGTVWVLKLMLGAFSGYLAISGVLSGAANAVVVKSARLAVGAVPLIGTALSDAAETVVAGAAAVKSVIGAAGVAGVLVITALPFLRLACVYALFRASSVLSAMTGAGETAVYAENLCEGFLLTLALCAFCTLLVLISIFAAILGTVRL